MDIPIAPLAEEQLNHLHADLRITSDSIRQETALIRRLCALRLAFLRGLPTWSDFGRGWQRRIGAVLDRALSLETRP